MGGCYREGGQNNSRGGDKILISMVYVSLLAGNNKNWSSI